MALELFLSLRRAHSVGGLEKLHRALVFLRRLERRKSTQVPSLAGLRVALPRVQPILPAFQFSDHIATSVSRPSAGSLHGSVAPSGGPLGADGLPCGPSQIFAAAAPRTAMSLPGKRRVRRRLPTLA